MKDRSGSGRPWRGWITLAPAALCYVSMGCVGDGGSSLADLGFSEYDRRWDGVILTDEGGEIPISLSLSATSFDVAQVVEQGRDDLRLYGRIDLPELGASLGGWATASVCTYASALDFGSDDERVQATMEAGLRFEHLRVGVANFRCARETGRCQDTRDASAWLLERLGEDASALDEVRIGAHWALIGDDILGFVSIEPATGGPSPRRDFDVALEPSETSTTAVHVDERMIIDGPYLFQTSESSTPHFFSYSVNLLDDDAQPVVDRLL